MRAVESDRPTESLTAEATLQRLERWGWILFLLCALLFTAAGLRDGDVLITLASVLFLVASVLFLVLHLRRKPPRGRD